MDNHQYYSLLDDFCMAVGIKDAQRVRETGLIEVTNFLVSLHFDGTRHASERLLLSLYIDTPSDINMEKYWYSLLTCNFIAGLNGRLRFSVNPANNSVVLSVRHEISSTMTGEQLASRIRDHVSAAADCWQQIITSVGR